VVPPREPLDQLEEAAQKALADRPRWSIRGRIAVGFFLMVALSAATTITSCVQLSSVERKLQALVVVDRVTIEVTQARRFEKNYFLYGTNLTDTLEHVRNARELLAIHLGGGDGDIAISRENLVSLAQRLDRYEALLLSLPAQEAGAPKPPGFQTSSVEEQVRGVGAELTAVVLDMATRERRYMERALALSKRVPLGFLAVIVLSTLYVANLLARQMLGPLTRLVNATQRFGAGDLTPLMPVRRYRDEFSDLAMAFNQMIHELERRQDILVESHKLRAVGTLTAGIAHELNNPLNNITLTATTLKEFYERLSTGQRMDMLDDLVSQAERSQGIVRNLLDYARRSEASMEPLNLQSVITEVVRLADNQIRFHGSTVEVHVPDGLPPVHGDRSQLGQVFMNLLLNALDAMNPGGQITVSVSADRAPGFVAVEVSDTGCGIPEHLLGSIFDPFLPTKTTGKGTGLGLSVSHGIVRRHGGEIRVRSQINVGSTFTVLLPVTPVQATLAT
jgi:signal transduction histidine kinase